MATQANLALVHEKDVFEMGTRTTFAHIRSKQQRDAFLKLYRQIKKDVFARYASATTVFFRIGTATSIC